jgi:hypothetical protein
VIIDSGTPMMKGMLAMGMSCPYPCCGAVPPPFPWVVAGYPNGEMTSRFTVSPKPTSMRNTSPMNISNSLIPEPWMVPETLATMARPRKDSMDTNSNR